MPNTHQLFTLPSPSTHPPFHSPYPQLIPILTSVMETQSKFTESIRLTSQDTAGRTSGYYIDVQFILSNPSAPSFEELCAGAVFASRLYPELTGALDMDFFQIRYELSGLVQPIPVMNGGQVPFAVDDFHCGDLNGPGFSPVRSPETFPCLDANSENDNSTTNTDQSQQLMQPHSYHMVMSEGNGSPVMVKLTQLKDGVVIGLSAHHLTFDAHGTGLIAKILAYCTRHVIEARLINNIQLDSWRECDITSMPRPFELTSSRESTKKSALYNPTPNFTTTPSASDQPFNRMCCRFVPKRNPRVFFEGLDTEGTGAITFRFNLAQQAVIKKAAEARAFRHGHTSFVSTRDAIVGYLFTLHLAATHLHNAANGTIEDPHKSIALAVPINIRKLIGLPDSYSGNAAPSALVEGKVFQDWFNGIGCPGLIRQTLTSYLKQHPVGANVVNRDGSIRDNVNGSQPTALRDLLQWLDDLTNGGDIDIVRNNIEFAWCHGPVGGYGDGSSTDWTRMGWRECHFTPAGEGEMAKFLQNLQNLQNTSKISPTPILTPPMIVLPPFVGLPGHIKLIDDVAGEEGAILAQLFLGKGQLEQVAPGAELHHALTDLEWIGRELNYSPCTGSSD